MGLIAAEPVAVLDRRMGKLGNKAVVYVLIQWSTGLKEEATWELTRILSKNSPTLIYKLGDKLLKGEGVDIVQKCGQDSFTCQARLFFMHSVKRLLGVGSTS